VPSTTLLEMPPAAQAQMRAVRRRMRYGALLAFPLLLLCAAGRNPTEIAACLFCSRASVYRSVRAYRPGSLGIRLDPAGHLSVAVRMTVLMPGRMRSLGAWLTGAPRASGWCRTRWSWAALAATLPATHGMEVAAATVRRWRHEMDWVWPRAKLVASDDAPHRSARCARLRCHHAPWQAHAVMVCADALESHRLPKVGAAWMPQGTQEEIMRPGQNEQHSLAGARPLATGKGLYCRGHRNNNGVFRALWTLLDPTDPARQVTRL
jgi:hypothetical protein